MQLRIDLQKITVWTHKWKMIFNPDISKQAQEVVFSRKDYHQKHLGLYLDENLNFNHHINKIISKVTDY